MWSFQCMFTSRYLVTNFPGALVKVTLWTTSTPVNSNDRVALPRQSRWRLRGPRSPFSIQKNAVSNFKRCLGGYNDLPVIPVIPNITLPFGFRQGTIFSPPTTPTNSARCARGLGATGTGLGSRPVAGGGCWLCGYPVNFGSGCKATWHHRRHGYTATGFHNAHTPLEDLLNGNHKKLRDRKGNAVQQEQIKTYTYKLT